MFLSFDLWDVSTRLKLGNCSGNEKLIIDLRSVPPGQELTVFSYFQQLGHTTCAAFSCLKLYQDKKSD